MDDKISPQLPAADLFKTWSESRFGARQESWNFGVQQVDKFIGGDLT